MVQAVNSQKLQKMGPYSHAVISGGFVFLSGQTGNVSGAQTTFETQFQNTVEKISDILKLCESSLDFVVKCNVYLSDAKNFQKMNELYAVQFTKNPPARTTLVTGFVSPEVLLEMDVVAEIPKQKTSASNQWPFT
ncbi:RutC family protein [Thermoplasmatales archaeon]|nr:RutC family protein [Thermoplasmatales archaeon]